MSLCGTPIHAHFQYGPVGDAGVFSTVRHLAAFIISDISSLEMGHINGTYVFTAALGTPVTTLISSNMVMNRMDFGH